MSLLRAQISPENTADLRRQVKTAVLDWASSHVNGAGEALSAIRTQEGLDASSGVSAYELFVAPAGTAFRAILEDVCREVAGQAGLRIDLEGWGSVPGKTGIKNTEIAERFGADTSPGFKVALVQHSDADFQMMQRFAETHPDALVIRRRRAMSQEVANEMLQIEQARQRPLEREMKIGKLDQSMWAALPVIGVEMGETAKEHPFVVLSRQDPLLGALYLAARAQSLIENPLVPQAWAQATVSAANQDQLRAAAYSGEYRFLSDMMARRALRGQQQAAALVEGLTPKEALAKCAQEAEANGLFKQTLQNLHKADQQRAEPEASESIADASVVMTRLSYYFNALNAPRSSPSV